MKPDTGANLLQHGDIVASNESRFNQAYFSQPLTTFAGLVRDNNDIKATLDFVAPRVNAARRFEYAEANNAEEFYSEQDDTRALGADFKRVEYSESKVNAKTINKGLTMRVDLDEVADKTNWENNYVASLLRRLWRNELRRAVAALSAAATNAAKTWDTTDGKDPDQDVMDALIAAANKSGVRPNRLLFGDTAWSKRSLAHRAQDTAGGFASASMTTEQLAGLMNVDKVAISRERYTTGATTKAEIVNNLVLAFMAMDDATTQDPSNIKRFVTPTEAGDYRVYTQQVNAKLYDITVEHYSLIAITSTLGIRKLTVS